MILAFLRARWPLGLAALVGAVLCRLLAPKPEPRLEWHDLRHYEGDMSEFVQINRVEGPERIVTKKYALTCPPQGPETDFHRPNGLEDRLVEETVTDRGPVTTETSTAKAEKTTQDVRTDLKVTPAPLPRFSLFFLPRLRPSVGLGVVGGGIRITQDFWIDGWAEPTVPAFGLGVRVTF